MDKSMPQDILSLSEEGIKTRRCYHSPAVSIILDKVRGKVIDGIEGGKPSCIVEICPCGLS